MICLSDVRDYIKEAKKQRFVPFSAPQARGQTSSRSRSPVASQDAPAGNLLHVYQTHVSLISTCTDVFTPRASRYGRNSVTEPRCLPPLSTSAILRHKTNIAPCLATEWPHTAVPHGLLVLILRRPTKISIVATSWLEKPVWPPRLEC